LLFWVGLSCNNNFPQAPSTRTTKRRDEEQSMVIVPELRRRHVFGRSRLSRHQTVLFSHQRSL
jgi:hypothetical protein